MDARRSFESQHPCEKCGFKRRYIASRACVECNRTATYLATVLPEGWQDEAKAIKADAEGLAGELGVSLEAVHFFLASFAVGCSGTRIRLFTGMKAKVCRRFADNCRAMGLWSWEKGAKNGTHPILNYDLKDANELEMAITIALNCMVMEGSLQRNRDMTYSLK